MDGETLLGCKGRGGRSPQGSLRDSQPITRPSSSDLEVDLQNTAVLLPLIVQPDQCLLVPGVQLKDGLEHRKDCLSPILNRHCVRFANN